MVSADALAIHVNVLQEAVQMEGDRDFSGIMKRLNAVCEALDTPIIIKEVGSGVSSNTAQRLFETGISAIDVGGRGGTSWGYIEGLRSSTKQTQDLADTFRNWGIPTAYSLVAVQGVSSSAPHHFDRWSSRWLNSCQGRCFGSQYGRNWPTSSKSCIAKRRASVWNVCRLFTGSKSCHDCHRQPKFTRS